MSNENAKQDAKRAIANVVKNMRLRDMDLKRTNIIPPNKDYSTQKCSLKKSNSGISHYNETSTICLNNFLCSNNNYIIYYNIRDY